MVAGDPFRQARAPAISSGYYINQAEKRGYLKTSIVDVWLMCPMYSSP